MKRLSLNSILTLALCLSTGWSAVLATAVPSSTEEEEEPSAIYWPSVQRPSLDVSEYQMVFDGHPIKMLEIKALDIGIELFRRPSMLIEASNSARYSAVIFDESLPDVTVGISVFDKREFLPDLDTSNWNAYLAGITTNSPNTKIVFENSNIEKRATPYVLNQKFRQVAYELESGSGTVVKKREIFAYVHDTLLVFSASGTKDAVDSNWFRFEQLIGEMTLSK